MRRGAGLAGILLALAGAACATAGADAVVDAERRRDQEFVDARGAAHLAPTAATWIAVQGGEAAATGPDADEAARAAAARDPRALHRFVFRTGDAGDRLHRLAFLPTGERVAGRKFLQDLGWRVVSVAPGGGARPVVLERHGARRTLDLSRTPTLAIEVAPLAGGASAAIDVTLDPDFDGPLLLPEDVRAGLDLARAEIPGRVEVQVALGRPFEARRAWASARCAALDASAPVEVLVPARGPHR